MITGRALQVRKRGLLERCAIATWMSNGMIQAWAPAPCARMRLQEFYLRRSWWRWIFIVRARTHPRVDLTNTAETNMLLGMIYQPDNPLSREGIRELEAVFAETQLVFAGPGTFVSPVWFALHANQSSCEQASCSNQRSVVERQMQHHLVRAQIAPERARSDTCPGGMLPTCSLSFLGDVWAPQTLRIRPSSGGKRLPISARGTRQATRPFRKSCAVSSPLC